MGGLRRRLAIALVALVAIAVLGIGVGTYLFVDARLRDALLADATRQAQFNLSVLVPDRLAPGLTADTFEATGLPAAFRLRGDVEEVVDFGAGGVYVSTARLGGALATFPDGLRSSVDAGRLGYAWAAIGGEPALVVAGRPATAPPASASPPTAPAFYFVFPAGSIDLALGQLRVGLAVAAAVALLLALATAGLVARGILRPVRAGSLAAARIAGGDLSARVAGGGSDELAAWAAEFNRMADSLASTIGRLEASESQNRRFVAEVSHELRTPVTALVAEASVIEAALVDLPSDARRAAELLVADVRRLRVLVDDLMELSRFDARAEQANLEPLDLGRVVGSIVAARLPGAAVSLPSHAVVVESEARRLDRILGNLLDNARTHAAGSPVEVAVAVDPGGAGASVTVADRGPGVAEDALPQLFDRFYKVDPSRSGGSSGMGLAIASEQARLLGASLTAAARPGGGLVFTLRLPATRSLRDGDDPVIDGPEADDEPDPSSPATLRSSE